LGLGVLASLIWHAIRNDLAINDFRWLAIAGMTLFYVGKQISYFVAIPPYRINKLINSVVCIGVTVAATYLPRAEWALFGVTLGMIYYAYSNFRWTLGRTLCPTCTRKRTELPEAKLPGLSRPPIATNTSPGNAAKFRV
jgi:hypothetical protein